jgi:hypothetical protein
METGAEYLLRKIDEQAQRYKDRLARGGASDYEDYRHITGLILALSWCSELIKDTTRKVANDEELTDE